MWKRSGRMLLNVVAAEPQAWEAEAPRKDKGHQERLAWGMPSGEKPVGIARRNTRLAGAANIVTYQLSLGNRRCKIQEFTGYSGNHAAAFGNKLRGLGPEAKHRVLTASGLCLFCLRHPASTECYGKGGPSKPACPTPGCNGRLSASVHDAFMGASANVSLVTDEGDEYDVDVYVNIARVGDEGDEWQDPDDSWLELEDKENEDDGRVFLVRAFTGGEDPEVEGKFVYYSDVSPRREEEPESREEGGWWTPNPSWLEPEEEDKEEVFFLNKILSEEQEEGKVIRIPNPDPRSKEECSTPQDVRDEEERNMAEEKAGKTRKQRRLRKKMTYINGEVWEAARKDARLRELLSSSSKDEEETKGKKAKTEEKYTRFEESSGWIKEMTSFNQGCEAQAGTKATLTKEREEGRQQQLPMDKMLGVLDSLDKRAEERGMRLEQIKARMRELYKEDEEGREALEEASPPEIQRRPTQVGEGRSRC